MGDRKPKDGPETAKSPIRGGLAPPRLPSMTQTANPIVCLISLRKLSCWAWIQDSS